MTARHAAEIFTTGIGVRNLNFRPGRAVSIDFGGGGEADPELACRVVEVVMIHPFLDVALLRIDNCLKLEPLTLWAQDPGAMEGREIVVIAYPRYDQRYGSELQNHVFEGRPGVKRIMPGRVLSPRLIQSLGRQSIALTHDCITLGGRSGAPVADVATGRVVGLSFASLYLDANFAVPMSELARDPKLWEAGLHFEGASIPSTAPWEEHWQSADGDEVMLAASVNAAQFASAPSSPEPALKALERFATQHFKEPREFRQFLSEHGYSEVVRAVPENAGKDELIRALNRRGAIDEAFLKTLGAIDPALSEGSGLPGGLSLTHRSFGRPNGSQSPC